MKNIAILLAAVLAAASLTACGGSASAPAASSESAASSEVVEATPEVPEDQPEKQPPMEDGYEMPEADPELSDLIDQLYAVKEPDFGVMTMPVDLADADWFRYYTGIEADSEAAGMVDALVASESAIGSQAYSVLLARVKDGGDANAVAEAMMNGVDPLKWICVRADDVRGAAAGNYAMVVMVSSEFADTITGEELVNALEQVAGPLTYNEAREIDLDNMIPEGAVITG